MNFFKGPLFEASQNIQKMAKFNGYKTFLVPKSLKKKLQHVKADYCLLYHKSFMLGIEVVLHLQIKV